MNSQIVPDNGLIDAWIRTDRSGRDLFSWKRKVQVADYNRGLIGDSDFANPSVLAGAAEFSDVRQLARGAHAAQIDLNYSFVSISLSISSVNRPSENAQAL
jgi:hypothetical protein